MEHKIKIYPVGNADCILVKLSNGKTIIFDCQIHADLYENGKQIWFDVKTDLLKELPKDSLNRPYVDLYVNTHPHDDHCRGFEGNFYHGDPDKYDKDKDNPPCFEARQEYKNRLMNSQNFFNTATFDVNSSDIPQPITYIIGSTGKRKELESTKAAESVVSRPAPRAGLK